jgi:hypothetical protein
MISVARNVYFRRCVVVGTAPCLYLTFTTSRYYKYETCACKTETMRGGVMRLYIIYTYTCSYRTKWLESNFLASGNRFWGRKVEPYTVLAGGGGGGPVEMTNERAAASNRSKVLYKCVHGIIKTSRIDDFAMRTMTVIIII